MLIIFDGNYLMSRALYSCSIKNTSNHIKLEGFDDRQLLATKIMWDISKVIEDFRPIITDVKFVFDKGSWRKELLDSNYKKNREEKKSTIDFDGFGEVQSELQKYLNNLNIQTFQIYNAEGDDLIKLLVDATDSDVLIFSADNDLIQLNQTTELKKVIQFSPVKNDVFITKSFPNKKELSFQDVLDNKMDISDYVMANNTTKTHNPTLELLSKIVRGDKGDGVESAQRGIGVKKMEKIFNSINEEYNFDGDITDWCFINGGDLQDILIPEIEKIIKKVNDDIGERIIENRKMVTLHEEYIPQDILDDFNDIDIYKGTIDLSKLSSFDTLIDEFDYIYNTTKTEYFSLFQNTK